MWFVLVSYIKYATYSLEMFHHLWLFWPSFLTRFLDTFPESYNIFVTVCKPPLKLNYMYVRILHYQHFNHRRRCRYHRSSVTYYRYFITNLDIIKSSRSYELTVNRHLQSISCTLSVQLIYSWINDFNSPYNLYELDIEVYVHVFFQWVKERFSVWCKGHPIAN